MKTLINQHKEFISQCKTIGEVNEREFRVWRCYEGKIPEELKEAIEKRKLEINGSNHSTIQSR